MSELEERKFGGLVPPPPGYHPMPYRPGHPLPPGHPGHPGLPVAHPIPPPPGLPGGIGMDEWMQYINAYIDVRARQMYDKLKSVLNGGSGSDVQVTPKLFSGTKVAEITVDGEKTTLFAPEQTNVFDGIILKDANGKKYLVKMSTSGDLTSEEYTED